MPRLNTLKVRFALLGLFFAFTLAARAFDTMTCDVCGKTIDKEFYWADDKMLGKKVKVCQACEAIEGRCYLCGLPVPDGSVRLADGRFICTRDLKDVVSSETDAKEVCSGVKDDVDRLLSRFLTLPGDNINLSIVDKYHLENLFSAPGNENSCVSIYGATSTHPLANHKFVHTVDLLSNLPKPRLMAVCAHEYTHAWMGENVSHDRQVTLDKDTVEAFCELVAYIYMESRNDEGEIAHLKRNAYTRGQILVLIEAYNKFGFNAVMEWIKNGEDTKLNMDNLDRVRVVRDGITPVPRVIAAPALVYGNLPPAPAPTTLMLKSISGSDQHRFAMINNTTFEAMEKGKVRLGQTNVSVRCLEIRNDSVTIQIDGSPEKKQLFLRPQ